MTAMLLLLTTGAISSSLVARRVAAFTAHLGRPVPVRRFFRIHQHPTAIQLQQHRGLSLLSLSSTSDGTNNPDDSSGRAPTDKYRSRPSSGRRRFSSRKDDDNNNWHVPGQVHIPEKQLEFAFVRSSGAGGQNVNKVNTCVQVRFHVDSALWMPFEVRQRFQQRFRNNINREGYYVTESQQERTQTANRRLVLAKLQRNVLEAWPRPHVRKVREGISAKGKEIRRKEKEIIKNKKEGRKSVIDFD